MKIIIHSPINIRAHAAIRILNLLEQSEYCYSYYKQAINKAKELLNLDGCTVTLNDLETYNIQEFDASNSVMPIDVLKGTLRGLFIC